MKLLHIGYGIYAVHFHKQQRSSKKPLNMEDILLIHFCDVDSPKIFDLDVTSFF